MLTLLLPLNPTKPGETALRLLVNSVRIPMLGGIRNSLPKRVDEGKLNLRDQAQGRKLLLVVHTQTKLRHHGKSPSVAQGLALAFLRTTQARGNDRSQGNGTDVRDTVIVVIKLNGTTVGWYNKVRSGSGLVRTRTPRRFLDNEAGCEGRIQKRLEVLGQASSPEYNTASEETSSSRNEETSGGGGGGAAGSGCGAGGVEAATTGSGGGTTGAEEGD